MTHIVNTKVVQSLGNLNLLLSVKESIGKLLALTQRRLDNLEARNIAQEIGDAGVMAVRVAGGGGVRSGGDFGEAFVLCRSQYCLSHGGITESHTAVGTVGDTVGDTIGAIGMAIDTVGLGLVGLASTHDGGVGVCLVC